MSTIKDNLMSLQDQIQSTLNLLAVVDDLYSCPITSNVTLPSNHTLQIASLVQDTTERLVEYENMLRLSIHPDSSKMSIGRCPDEILQYVFSYVIDGGSHRLGPLLLVDKRFHQVVVSSPCLWTNIHLWVDDFFDEQNRLPPKFVEACVERSQAALLDVSIRIQSLCRKATYLERHIQPLIEQGNFSDDCTRRSAIVSTVVRGDHYRAYDDKLQRILDLVGTTVGSNGDNMRRWRTFRLAIGSATTSICERVLKLFVGEVPNLQRMDIESLSGSVYRKIVDNSYTERQFRGSLFTNMSNVRHIGVSMELALTEHSVSTENLEYLRVLYTSRRRRLEQMNHFSSLVELHLDCVNNLINEVNPIPFVEDITIRVPSLLRLVLAWDIRIVDHITFDAPNLQSLNLRCSSYQLRKYGSRREVAAPAVEWKVEMDRERNESTLQGLFILVTAVKSLKDLRLVTEEDLVFSEVAMMLGVARAEGAMSSELRSIDICTGNGNRVWQV